MIDATIIFFEAIIDLVFSNRKSALIVSLLLVLLVLLLLIGPNL